MAADPLSTASLDYLQRSGISPLPLPAGSPVASPQAVRVAGVGVLDKGIVPGAGEAALAQTAGMLTGLYGHKVPLAFQLRGGAAGIEVRLGTWTDADGLAAPARLQRRFQVLTGLLKAAHPAVALEPAPGAPLPLASAGLALGVPTAHPPDPRDGSLAVDRLIRAMSEGEWMALVLADPLSEDYAGEVRDSLLNEARMVQAASLSSRAPSPLAAHHTKLLQAGLDALSQGQAIGTWRVAVYLGGDSGAYHRLAAVWQATFSGEGSVPEPIRVWRADEAAALAAGWAMPYAPGPPGHGPYRHPFLQQTLLTSAQLAAYVHLPQRETAGFQVTRLPHHDVVPPAVDGTALRLGDVVDSGRVTGTPYQITPRRLTRHALVAGITGSGKTTTIMNLLMQAAARGVPFLVVEPAKAEYRALLEVPGLGEELLVFTLGDETVAPLRLNPFEVPPGIAVGVHLDLLRSAFVASFGMWTPLPQVLERCLHGIYEDCGWDLTNNYNRRLDEGADRADSFPTLSQLVDKVDEVITQLGYEDRITADFRAALHTRLNTLRTGGKGRMLDTTRAVPPLDSLFARPAVLELQQMGDAGDIAFVIGLLLIRLAEHRRAAGPSRSLRHLLVIEEAHRLLAAPGLRRSEEEADPRGAAVETFTNLLAELRAYGQGVVVADQIPVKLSPDVLKNTDLKVAHRTVAADDRLALAGAMAMQPAQGDALATLPVGRAALFGDGDDGPLLVQMPRLQSLGERPPSEDEVRAAMAGREELKALAHLYLPSADCEPDCLRWPAACEVARELAEDPEVMRTVSRTVLSAVQTPGGLERTWPELLAMVASRRPEWIEAEPLLRSVVTHTAAAVASRRGARAGWTYADTRMLRLGIRLMLESRLDDRGGEEAAGALRASLLELQGDGHGPFEGCSRIWEGREGPCLCRYPVAELVAGGGFDERWEEAAAADGAEEDGRPATWEVCQDAAWHLVEFPVEDQDPELAEQLADVARRTALCFGQQMLSAQPWAHPRMQRRVLEELVEQAGHE